MIFLSYHSRDLIKISEFLYYLLPIRNRFWLDRLQIAPHEPWAQSIADQYGQADAVFVFLTHAYSNSAAHLRELQHLDGIHSPLIAILAPDFQISTIADLGTFSDVLYLDKYKSPKQLQDEILRLIGERGLDLAKQPPREKTFYADSMILSIEKLLLSESFTQLSLHEFSKNSVNHDDTVSPRGYFPALITASSFMIRIENEYLQIEDLLELTDIQPYLLLNNLSSWEATHILRLLALAYAHKYKRNHDIVLPIYLDAATFDAQRGIEQWLSENWKLTHDCNAYLNNNTIKIFIDAENIATEHAIDLVHQITVFCLENEHSFVVSGSAIGDTEISDLPIVSVSKSSLSQTLTKSILSNLLTNSMLDNLISSIYQSKTILGYSYDSITLFAEYAIDSAADEIEGAFPPPHFVASILASRWRQAFEDIDLPISFREFFDAMKFLAWHMFITNQIGTIKHHEVQHILGDLALINLALDLQVLHVASDSLRFNSRLIQNHLAAYILFDDGIYKHLRPPQFDTFQRRLAKKWDEATLSIFNIVEPVQRIEVFEHIADIDPLLATQFASQSDALLTKCLCHLTEKLLGLSSKFSNSKISVVQTLNSLPEKLQVADCIVGIMRSESPKEQLDTFDILMQIPYGIPQQYIKEIHNLDREFADASAEILLHASQNNWVLYLGKFATDSDPQIQMNAIHVMSEMKDPAITPILLHVIRSANMSAVKKAISALPDVILRSHLSLVVDCVQRRHMLPEIVMMIFKKSQRPISYNLIKLLKFHNKDLKNLSSLLANSSEEKVSETLKNTLRNIKGDNVKSYNLKSKEREMTRLNALVSRFFETVRDKDIFDSLVDDLTNVLEGNSLLDPNSTMDMDQKKTITSNQLYLDTSKTNLPAFLIEHLNDPRWATRFQAIQRLEVNETGISELLVSIAVSDPEPQVRLIALEMLATQENPSEPVITVFTQSLTSPELQIVDAATDFFKQRAAIDTSQIVSLLDNDNVQTIAAAIEILSIHEDPTAIEPLKRLLNDKRRAWLDDLTIGDRATNLLKQLQTGNIPIDETDDLVKTMSFQSQSQSPKQVASTMSKRGYTPTQKVKLTLNAIAGEDWELSQKAAKYLRKLAEKHAGSNNYQVISILESALKHDNWTVRWAVVEALAMMKATDSSQKIAVLLHDTNWTVQVASIRSLVELNAYDSAEEIVQLLNVTNSAVAETAAEALGELKHPDTFDPLIPLLSSDNEFIRLHAIQSMLKISVKKTRPFLVRMLTDSYNHIRWMAMRALSEDPPENAIQLIGSLLPDKSTPTWEDNSVGDYAVIALRKLNTPESLQVIADWQNNTGVNDL